MRPFLNLKTCVKTGFINNCKPLLIRTTAMDIVVEFPGYHRHVQPGDNNDNNGDNNNNYNNKEFNFF